MLNLYRFFLHFHAGGGHQNNHQGQGGGGHQNNHQGQGGNNNSGNTGGKIK